MAKGDKQTVVFYWVTEPKATSPLEGKWRWCKTNVWPEFRAASIVIADMNKMGYVAREGASPGDMPTKPPTSEEFAFLEEFQAISQGLNSGVSNRSISDIWKDVEAKLRAEGRIKS